MSVGPQPKGPRLWLEPERTRKGRAATPAAWCIRDDGGYKRRLSFSADDRRSAEEALQDYLAEKHAIPAGERHPSQRLTADILALYARDVAPDHERPEEARRRIERLLSFWAQPALAVGILEDQGIKGEALNGFATDIRTVTCKTYYRWVGANRTAAMDLELLRAAINHSVKEEKLDRPVLVWMPEAGQARERWLTRSEAAQILWVAWRQKRSDNARARWPHLPRALALRAQGKTSSQIAAAVGSTRNQVAGQLWRHDQREADGGDGLLTTQHVARFILVSLYTGKRKSAALLGAFERKPGYGYIDLGQGVWHPPAGKRRTKKRQPPQPLPAPLLGHLRRWKRNGQRHPVEYDGLPVERLDKAFRALVRGLEFDDVVIHSLRHTAITWGLQRGMELWQASGYFGVSVEVLDRVYGHHSPNHLRDAAAKMARPAPTEIRRQSGDRVRGTK